MVAALEAHSPPMAAPHLLEAGPDWGPQAEPSGDPSNVRVERQLLSAGQAGPLEAVSPLCKKIVVWYAYNTMSGGAETASQGMSNLHAQWVMHF